MWIGKWGRRIGPPLIRTLRGQINLGIPTYVFLAKYGAGTYLVHACELIDISNQVDDDKLIPSYYRDRKFAIYTWLKISRMIQLVPNIFDELIGLSSRMPIIQTLKKSMTGVLWVLLKSHQQIEDFIFEEKRF